METHELRLVLSRSHAWELILTPVAVDAGLPLTITFTVQLCFSHTTGRFTYAADDLSFTLSSFADLGASLHSLLMQQTRSCTFGAVGGELRLTFRRYDIGRVGLEMQIRERQSNDAPIDLSLPTSLHGYDELERLQRWSATFARDLAEWLAERSAGSE